MDFNPSMLPGETDEAYDTRIKDWIASLDKTDSGAIIMPLAWPIEVSFKKPGQDMVTELLEALTLRRPQGADLRAVDVKKPASVVVLERIERLVAGSDGKPVSAEPAVNVDDVLAAARKRRDQRLADSDYTQLPDSPMQPQARKDWAKYRNGLRHAFDQVQQAIDDGLEVTAEQVAEAEAAAEAAKPA